MNYVDNILKVYGQSTPTERKVGRGWYADARREAQSMGVPPRIGAGVIAALSPNNSWERNKQDARTMVQCYLSGGSHYDISTCTYNTMKLKAWHVLTEYPTYHTDVAKILKGPKITCFFRNILGYDDCTIDGHAINIANGQLQAITKSPAASKSMYQIYQQAYRDAAKHVGMKSYHLQAITWTTWKRLLSER